jgi:uncharacterized membrane protein
MVTMPRLALIVFLVLCALCLAQPAYYYPQLPEKVAVHFGVSGTPDSWSGKWAFTLFSYAVVLSILVLFLGISHGMSRIPPALINMPNKDYWLSENRRRETTGFMSRYVLWLGSGTVLFLLDIFHQSIQVSLGRTAGLPHIYLSLGLYACFVAAWTIGLYKKFGQVSEEPKR